MSHRVLWVDLSRFDTKPNKSPWLEMGSGLSARGFQTNILTSFAKAPYSSPDHGDIEILSFRSSPRTVIFRVVLLLKIGFWLLRNAKRSDVVILPPGGLYLAPLLRLMGCKRLHLDFRTVPVEIHGMADKLNRFVYWKLPVRLFSSLCRSFSFITLRLQQQVETEFNRQFVPATQWCSGVNTEMFLNSEPDDQETFTLFYHGTITANRGLASVVEALGIVLGRRELPIRLRIVGAGSGVGEVLETVERLRLGERVDYVGLVPYSDMPEEIAKADLCICPLPNRPEWNVSSPLKVFEYLAAGKPIIVTRIPAHEDVLGDEAFIVWSATDDSEGMADAIEQGYDNRHSLHAVAEREAAQFATRFDWSVQSAVLAGFLEEQYVVGVR